MKQSVFLKLIKSIFIHTCVLLAVAGMFVDAQLCAMAAREGAAVIIAHIADMNNSYPAPVNPPACGQVNPSSRAHQGLPGELVHWLEESGDDAKIAYDTTKIVYGFDNETGAPLSTFWVNKEHVKLLADMPEDVRSVIPHPRYGQEPTVRLTYSWQDMHGHMFSAGTRFKHVSELDTERAYAVLLVDYRENRVQLEHVPFTDAIIEKQEDNAQVKRELCVDLTYNFVNRVTASGHNHVVPYVLGANTFIQPYIDLDQEGKATFYVEDGVWQRDGEKNPYSGYDCSELIRQMADNAGIEFPWKTTWAIERSRPALQEGDVLQAGDIIWVPGHVMFVGRNNDLIEARGYGSGYGRVHIIPLSECLVKEDGQSFETYEELLEYYYENGKVRFRNRLGNIQELPGFNHFKLLKLVD